MLMLMDCWIASGKKTVCGRRSRMRGCERREPAQASTEDLDAVSIRVANLAGEIGDAGNGVCSVRCGDEIMVMGEEKDEERDGDIGEDGGGDTERRGDDNAGREGWEGVMGVARMVLRVGTEFGGGMESAREEVEEEVCVKKGDEPASAFVDVEAFGAHGCDEIPLGADESGDKDNESAGMDGDGNGTDFDVVASGRGD